MVLHTHVDLLLEHLHVVQWHVVGEHFWCTLDVEHLVHLVDLLGDFVLLSKLLVHNLMCVGVHLIVTDININHVIDTLHINQVSNSLN
tara:strand:- start:91 stop:354 length:264 start_codon:yes stop_codon:yes gene_type:complete